MVGEKKNVNNTCTDLNDFLGKTFYLSKYNYDTLQCDVKLNKEGKRLFLIGQQKINMRCQFFWATSPCLQCFVI